jgi:predicted nuclease with TOPRIM domain
MPDKYIKRKGIIFDGIAEKGDADQVTKFQKENSQLMEKVERLEVVDSTLRGEYKEVIKAFEFVMELVFSFSTS